MPHTLAGTTTWCPIPVATHAGLDHDVLPSRVEPHPRPRTDGSGPPHQAPQALPEPAQLHLAALHQIVWDDPACTPSQAARQLRMCRNRVSDWAHRLATEGRIQIKHEAGRRHLLPAVAGLEDPDWKQFLVLKDDQLAGLYCRIAALGPCIQKTIAEMGRSRHGWDLRTTQRRLRALESSCLIRRAPSLTDARMIHYRALPMHPVVAVVWHAGMTL